MDYRRSITEGGTLVTITGTNFVQTPLLRCKFNSTIVVASYLSGTTCKCVAPPHEAGHVLVDISNNNQDYTTDGLFYEFFRTLSLLLFS
jgi:hypothetical protein